ncbi:FecR domain-containing protein [Paraflavisolibacter sp. H34]|uniref:FecR family protein n=1 Tax=Huijunlia imazamoxiresistens TaxID=3127457 RepID=UPI0030179E7E
MSLHEFDQLLRKYLLGQCTAPEEQEVQEWYGKLAAESALELSDQERYHLEERMWPLILAGIGEAPRQVSGGQAAPFGSVRFIRMAVAACLVVLVSLGLYFLLPFIRLDQSLSQLGVPEGYRRFANEGKAARAVHLSDGSVVTLDPKASLYFPDAFREKSRDVYLAGNAFFQVSPRPGNRFVVHADEGLLAEVLGTSFYMHQDRPSKQVEISVVSGKVWVHEGPKPATLPVRQVVLAPNQKVVYAAGRKELVAALADEPKLLPGVDHRFDFEETLLGNVLQSLSKAYGIVISTADKNLAGCHFTGDLTRQGLYDKLRIICLSTGSSFQVIGTSIVLTGAGCP